MRQFSKDDGSSWPCMTTEIGLSTNCIRRSGWSQRTFCFWCMHWVEATKTIRSGSWQKASSGGYVNPNWLQWDGSKWPQSRPVGMLSAVVQIDPLVGENWVEFRDAGSMEWA